MLILILFVSFVATICTVTLWSRPTVAKVATSRPETSAAEPASLEGLLVAKLLARDISTTQYRYAIEGLAARDEDRHPLSVPLDLGSVEA